MKKTLIALSLVTCSLFAIGPASINSVSPKTYKLQAFSLDLSSSSGRANIEGTEQTYSLLSNLEIKMANKATLSTFSYRKGETYWRGAGSYSFSFAENNSTLFQFELGTGVSYNFGYIFMNADIGAAYGNGEVGNLKKINSGDTQVDSSETDSSEMWEGLASVFIGIPLDRKIDIGVRVGYGLGSLTWEAVDQKVPYALTKVALPISYNVYKEITVDLEYSWTKRKDTESGSLLDYNENRVMIGVTWK